jgi:hypothetical protein
MRTVDLNNWDAFEAEITALFEKYPWASKSFVRPMLFREQSDASWKLQSTLEFKEMGSATVLLGKTVADPIVTDPCAVLSPPPLDQKRSWPDLASVHERARTIGRDH